ncbi:hypothetical protein GA845_17955 [Burkholderia pseudomallei]|nr:hypothetical protein [Burkholderia pseudomallei]NRE35259.1 hypothetical protein [Burkholderia pseudomallei]
MGEWGEESRFYRGAHRGIPAPSECDPDGAARFCRFARRRALRGRRFSGRRTLPDARRGKRRGEQWTKGPRGQGAKGPRPCQPPSIAKAMPSVQQGRLRHDGVQARLMA